MTDGSRYCIDANFILQPPSSHLSAGCGKLEEQQTGWHFLQKLGDMQEVNA